MILRFYDFANPHLQPRVPYLGGLVDLQPHPLGSFPRFALAGGSQDVLRHGRGQVWRRGPGLRRHKQRRCSGTCCPGSGGGRQGSGVAAHHLHPVLLHAAAGLEVGADALARPLLELRELPAAGLDDGLDLLLGLLGDGHHPVQVLVHEKAHKHLQRRRQTVGTPSREVGGLALPVEPSLR